MARCRGDLKDRPAEGGSRPTPWTVARGRGDLKDRPAEIGAMPRGSQGSTRQGGPRPPLLIVAQGPVRGDRCLAYLPAASRPVGASWKQNLCVSVSVSVEAIGQPGIERPDVGHGGCCRSSFPGHVSACCARNAPQNLAYTHTRPCRLVRGWRNSVGCSSSRSVPRRRCPGSCGGGGEHCAAAAAQRTPPASGAVISPSAGACCVVLACVVLICMLLSSQPQRCRA